MAARRPGSGTVEQLLAALDQAVEVTREFTGPVELVQAETASPESLLDQCIALCEPQEARVEPVRTLHQMACTGGTLFAKCVAAMPNVQLLSEVDPLSRMQLDPGHPRFCPTDMVLLLRQGTRGANDELVVRMFQAALEVVHADATARGQRLVLRDHAHSHYGVVALEPRPTLRDMVAQRFPALSLVLVRHPLDSYLSLLDNGWVGFAGGLDEYCRRYLSFLDDHGGIPVLRYEDFVRDPERRLREACDHLRLRYSGHFAQMFDIFRLSGDSGRSGNVIERRPRRQTPDASLGAELAASRHYALLLQRLDYDA